MNDSVNAAPVITVDGPAGAGKGTLTAGLAENLGFHLLDSGALYRMLAWRVLRDQIPLTDTARLEVAAKTLRPDYDGSEIILDNVNVTDAIRTQEVSGVSSEVAAIPAVRLALIDAQRAACRSPGLIADGRDMGTVIFPHAVCKFFISATPEIRAKRRYKQLKEKGIESNMRDLLREIEERDARDANRAAAPLKPAEDAIVMDTSLLTIPEVLEKALFICQQRLVRHRTP
jgi:cytidylate kinase